jgi:hypothetical protein
MKNGDLLHNENLMSHEDIIRLFNINDTQVNCDKFVRIEFAPNDTIDYSYIEKYELKVDESNVPDWFEKHREYIINQLKEIVSKYGPEIEINENSFKESISSYNFNLSLIFNILL